jgi:hypothetical protein
MKEDQIFKHAASGRAVVALAVTLFALLAGTSAASATAGTDSSQAGFAAQAKGLGLTSSQAKALQSKADGYLAKTNGFQVSANKIRLDSGAVMTLALPGEKFARNLGAKATAGTQSAAYICGYGHMCAYSGTFYSGDVIDMWACRYYPIPWSGDGSWINNQTTGTVAWFINSSGGIGWASPGAFSFDDVAPWGWVFSVNNC